MYAVKIFIFSFLINILFYFHLSCFNSIECPHQLTYITANFFPGSLQKNHPCRDQRIHEKNARDLSRKAYSLKVELATCACKTFIGSPSNIKGPKCSSFNYPGLRNSNRKRQGGFTVIYPKPSKLYRGVFLHSGGVSAPYVRDPREINHHRKF